MDTEVLDLFRNYLRREGHKITSERMQILQEVFLNHSHFGADTIFFNLYDHGRKVSRATVYRTLELLVKSGLVQKISFGEHQARYEHTFGHKRHNHLICSSCGKVEEFTNSRLEQIIQMIGKQRHFRVRNRSIQIFGYCSECR